MEEWNQYKEYVGWVISAILGAAASGIPLYRKLRNINLDIQGRAHTMKVQEQIDTEAEWKRILEERNTELQRLRERDDQQEAKITDLYNKNLECRTSEAALKSEVNMLRIEVAELKKFINQNGAK